MNVKTPRPARADRLMILFMWLLVASPFVYLVVSPGSWSYAAALSAQKRGEFNSARQQFQQIVATRPGHAASWYRLSEIAYELNEFEESLQAIETAEEVVRSERQQEFVTLQKANVYIVLGKGQEAVETLLSLRETFAKIPEGYRRFSRAQLVSLASRAQARSFLNMIAYFQALGNVDLRTGLKQADATIGFFEGETWELQLAIPYLLERSSHYQSAFDAYQDILDDLRADVSVMDRIEDRISDFKQKLLDLADKDDPQVKKFSLQLQSYRSIARYERQAFVLHRMIMLAEKLDVDSSAMQEQLEKIQSTGSLPDNVLELKLDDARFLSIASEVHNYYDTRALIRLRMGEQKEIEFLDNPVAIVESQGSAEKLYQSALKDSRKALAYLRAVQAYRERFPENSPIILPQDDMRELERNELKVEAVELFHLSQILTSLRLNEEAEETLESVRKLGFEPSAKLF